MWVPLRLFYRWKSGLREVKSMLFKVTRPVRWCQDSNLTRSTSRPALFPLDPRCSKCDALSSPSSHREPLQNAGDSALPPTCRARICIWTSPPAVLYACQAEKLCPQPPSSGNVRLCPMKKEILHVGSAVHAPKFPLMLTRWNSTDFQGKKKY